VQVCCLDVIWGDSKKGGVKNHGSLGEKEPLNKSVVNGTTIPKEERDRKIELITTMGWLSVK